MNVYAQHVSTRTTPQSQPIPDKPQVQNSAGGYAFAVDDWSRLDRFLILGNEGGTYYATEQALTVENAACVRRCFDADPVRTVKTIVDVSEGGRAPKNDPAIFALAMCSTHPAALAAVPRVCRTGTHLFQYAQCVEAFRGHGRALNRALRRWYLDKTPKDVAYQVTKYQQRNGWSHRDILRLSKPTTAEVTMSQVFAYAVGKLDRVPLSFPCDDPALELLYAVERAKASTSAAEIVNLIRDHGLVREHIPTERLNDAAVWDALLEKMPLTAMVRNLGKMSSVGLLTPMSSACQTVVKRLYDGDYIRKSRLHPLAILIALSVYRQGRGVKGSLTWQPRPGILDALDGAFYLAFENVEATGKRWLLGVDVSGSMTWGEIAGSPLTPRVAAAAMSMVAVRSERMVHAMAFSHHPVPLPLSKSQRLDDVVQMTNGMPFGATDCAQPMLYALKNGIEADVFVVYTDNETWCGQIHPCQALRQYREQTGIPAKLIVCGMTATGFSIADPSDGGMMDVVGFDASAPAVMSQFAAA